MGIYIAGDGTMAHYDIRYYPLTGIGNALSLYLRQEIRLQNLARPGKSTRSFIDQGDWRRLERELGFRDFLLISFGYEENKSYCMDQYTIPYGIYQDNLKTMVRSAKEVAAIPILITPLSYREYLHPFGGTERYTLVASRLADYAGAMRELAEEERVALIDLYTQSRALLEDAGPKGSAKWYLNSNSGKYPIHPEKENNIGLSVAGAVVFAGLIAEELKKLGEPYSYLLADGIFDKQKEEI